MPEPTRVPGCVGETSRGCKETAVGFSARRTLVPMSSGVAWLDLLEPLGSSLAQAVDATREFTPSRFGGRLHPLLVHFPIALVFAAAAVECWRAIRREPGFSPASAPLLIAAAVMSVLAAGSGWLNAAWERDGDATDPLFWHRWLGTGSAVLLVAVAWIAWRSRRDETFASMHVARRLGALVAALCVAIVGHIGGELVHGEGYILAGLQSRQRSTIDVPRVPSAEVAAALRTRPGPFDPQKQAYFLASVQPVFEARCVECHGAKKQKGGLRLAPIAAAFVGTLDTWPIVPGRPDASEILKRVQLPVEDPDAMPPKGERLTSDQIAALRRWIADGAALPDVEEGVTKPNVPPARTEASRADSMLAIDRLRERGAMAQPIFTGSPLYELNASFVTPAWTDADMGRIGALASSLAELNLARSAITDEVFASVAPLPELTQLRLDRTAVGDRALPRILAMPKLEVLNLVGTGLTDAGLADLIAHPALKRVYVWESKVTADGARSARAMRPDIDVVAAPGDAVTTTSVPPPSTPNMNPS